MEDRKNLISAVENFAKVRNNPVLLLNLDEVHRIQSIEVHRLLCNRSFDVLDVVLQTPGGNIETAFNIAKLLRKSAQKVSIVVPLYAKSAGTLIAMSGDKIILTEISELGPLDTQIPERKEGGDPEYVSALNGFKALEQTQAHTIQTLDIATKLIMMRSIMNTAEAVHLANEFTGLTSATLYSKLNPERIGEYARALEVGLEYGVRLLTRYLHWPKDKADEAVRNLVYSYPSHAFIIDDHELQSLGFETEQLNGDELDRAISIRDALMEVDEDIIELVNDNRGRR